MRIEISARGMELTEVIRDHVQRRLYFAVGRFSARVKNIRVGLVDKHGPENGLDKTCNIAVRLLELPTVTVTQTSADLPTAVAIAADRAGRTVALRLAVHG